MSDRGVETIESLVEKLDLTEVVFYQVAATLREEEAPSEIPDGGHKTDYGFRTRHVGNEFGVRFRVDITAPQGEVVVDLACEYASDEPLRIPRDVAFEFVNNVALMQAFPFWREAVLTLTTRVFREPILLKVFMRGELAFPLDGEGPDISDGAAKAAAQEG
ncbi:hypothetical protein [Microbacterium sp. 3J1]|uniref:hypothetical protein n=1 Tax=Microbacterium sp. 3J1 TaxID=861269 RepID=UPI000AE0A431|nr:hypothetical protein [Microbacterium sp. 3J1]